MPKVLLIDDETMYYRMVERALTPSSFELAYANTGLDGLKIAVAESPEIFIIDIQLPDMQGFEIVQRLRKDPRFERASIIILSSQSDIADKVKAFEMGADDYLVKPFQPEELVARVNLLYRRNEALKRAQVVEATVKETGRLVAVHSLRGGVGCSIMAINLSSIYHELWGHSTLVVDGVLNAGQIALMLNSSVAHSWEDLSGPQASVDETVLHAIINKHKSGLNFFPAPPHSIAYDSLPQEIVTVTVEQLRGMYEFLVVDLAHDFSNFSITMLSLADQILLMLAPEMASIHAAVNALEIYENLGIPQEKIIPVINNIFPQQGIKQAQIEKVLKRQVGYYMPYVPSEFIRSINFGEPFVNSTPDSTATEVFEDIAYELSDDRLKNIPPMAPTQVWKRMSARYQRSKKKNLW